MIEQFEYRILAPSRVEIINRGDFNSLRKVTVPPFAAERIELLAKISGLILRDVSLKFDPAAAALGFWLRKSNLMSLNKKFFEENSGVCVPAGLVLHITPANVDTMFVYSWALSYLAGNANVVRLTTRMSQLMTNILAVIDVVFVQHSDAAKGNYFVVYAQNDDLTESLSMACDQRIVWGGNETVARLRAIPMNPHAGERSFASKRSLSVFNAKAFTEASTQARQHLADAVVMDILPFGQMACSSPHTVYWLGSPASLSHVIKAFGEAVQNAFVKRSVGADLGWAVRRLNAVFSEAAKGRVQEMYHSPNSTQYILDSSEAANVEDPCGAGLLAHANCQTIDEIDLLLGPRHQTITHFGLSPKEQDKLAWIAGRSGVDRVVPAGKALGFSAHWDGFNLWNDLTRTVDLQR